MRPRPLLSIALLLGSLLLGSLLLGTTLVARARPAQAPPRTADTYVFSYFVGNGEDGLHLAASDDGLRWTPLNGGRAVLTSAIGTGLMRDPCIVRGPDGRFHAVWTTGWWDRVIGIAHSTDLVSWSTPRAIPVMMHEPDAVNAWAPELTYDRDRQEFVIYWSTTIKGKFPKTGSSGDHAKEPGVALNHRIYATTTRDFETYTPTRLLYDGGFNAIDATIVEDTRLRKFVMFVKDETKHPVARKHIRVATADRLLGPYSAASEAITPDWVEGPTLLHVGPFWMLYFDEYTRKRYGAVRSDELLERGWQPLPASMMLRFPPGARHGTTFTAPAQLVDALRADPRAGAPPFEAPPINAK